MVTKKTPDESSRRLARLADLYGVQASYRDDRGRVRCSSEQSLLAALAALGAGVTGRRGLDAAVRAREAEWWDRLMEPVLIAWDGALPAPVLRMAAGDRSRAGMPAGGAVAPKTVRLTLLLEDGRRLSGDLRLEPGAVTAEARVDGRLMRAVTPPAGTMRRSLGPDATLLPAGYHRLRVEAGGSSGEALVISTPRRCWMPPSVPLPGASGLVAADPAAPLRGLAGSRWGVFAPVYSLRSARDWGAGDLADLNALAAWTERQGGSFVATLPLFASHFAHDADPSPYRPLSRLFWNELYLAPEDTDEWGICEAVRSRWGAAAGRTSLETPRAGDVVDYAGVGALKRSVLQELARCFFERPGGAERERYDHYLAENPLAESYAAFRAGFAGARASAAGVATGAAADVTEEVRYHLYCQWQMERQLARLSAAHGLLLDLPLGVHPEGFDAQHWPDLLVQGASLGAPPDSFFTGGQDWCAPPLHPEADRRGGYAYFRACLAALMRPASVLRIDHVMGLHRLFWIPEGADPKDGVYVTYPAEELYALLSCESHRHRTEVVGEDLGTVPKGVRASMHRHGVARTWIFLWSLGSRGPIAPAAVPPDSVATLGTHDMVPLAGFLNGDDIQIRVETGQLDAADADGEAARRRRLVDRLATWAGAPVSGRGRAAAVLAGALAFLGRSPARMVMVSLDDLLLERRPQNVPGTSSERPNWRGRMAVPIEELPEARSEGGE